MSTKENDLVLDYHLGSGTTAAVADKMNRQYIGIEQVDYIETVAVERLKKVINGEQGGISKAVNWQDGGEFIYLELKKYNQDMDVLFKDMCQNEDIYVGDVQIKVLPSNPCSKEYEYLDHDQNILTENVLVIRKLR